jgi:hypothetical protein
MFTRVECKKLLVPAHGAELIPFALSLFLSFSPRVLTLASHLPLSSLPSMNEGCRNVTETRDCERDDGD